MRAARVSTLAASAVIAAFVAMPSAQASSAPADLSGAGHGSWQLKPSNPDTGTQRVVHGHGNFSIGKARIRGSVTSPGFIANGACSVSLRLVTDTGSLSLSGHTKRTSSSYPTCVGESYRFRFHTTKATGDLADASYEGVGHFDLENASTDVTDNGSFTLKLKPLASPTAHITRSAPSLLTGDGHGTFEETQNSAADLPTKRALDGHGTFSIGKAQIRGVVTAPGFVYEGSCQAVVRLVTDTGAIKLVGHSKVRSRSSDQPICDGHKFRFHFHTTKSRGDLEGVSYKGVGLFELTDASNDVPENGTFTLLLRVPRD